MTLAQKQNKKTSNLILFAFIASMLYWAYLFIISQMLLVQDAAGYKEMGETVAYKGWVSYLSSGPAREPFYIFLISLSIKIANATSIAFTTIQKLQHVIFLFATQIITYKLLRKLRINKFITCASILYIGFSPAIINTYLCLFSEIAILPFIPATILQCSKVWQLRNSSSLKILSMNTLLLGLLFTILTFTKGIFEVTLLVFFLPFAIIMIHGILSKQRSIWLPNLLVIFCLLASFSLPVNLYKYANKRINGTFALTNRASFALFGNLKRRNEQITPIRLKTALAFAVGEAFCLDNFNQIECRFWSYHTSDNIAGQQRLEYLDLTATETNKRFMALAKKELIKKPLNQVLFASIEALKMFFFESPNNIGFVVYPRWLEKIYHTPWIAYPFEFFTASLSFISFLFCILYCWTQRKIVLSKHKDFTSISLILPSFLLVAPFIGMHSLFFVLPRYGNPIIPLHIANIAFFLNALLLKTKKD